MPRASPSSRWTSGLAGRLSRIARPVSWLTMSLKQFDPFDEFLKSTVVPAAIVSGNTFRSIPWWRDTNGFTRRFSIWRRREHKALQMNASSRAPFRGPSCQVRLGGVRDALADFSQQHRARMEPGRGNAFSVFLRGQDSAQPGTASRANKRHDTNQSLAWQAVSSRRNLERKWCQLRALF